MTSETRVAISAVAPIAPLPSLTQLHREERLQHGEDDREDHHRDDERREVEGEAVEHRGRDDEPDRVGGHGDRGPDEEPDHRDATLHHDRPDETGGSGDDERRARPARCRVVEAELRGPVGAYRAREEPARVRPSAAADPHPPAADATLEDIRPHSRPRPDLPPHRGRQPRAETCTSGSENDAIAGFAVPDTVSSPLCQAPSFGSSRTRYWINRSTPLVSYARSWASATDRACFAHVTPRMRSGGLVW